MQLFQPRRQFLLGFFFLIIYSRSQQTSEKGLRVNTLGSVDNTMSVTQFCCFIAKATWGNNKQSHGWAPVHLHLPKYVINVLTYVFFSNFCSFKIYMKVFEPFWINIGIWSKRWVCSSTVYSLKKLSFLCWTACASLSKIHSPYMYRSISGLYSFPLIYLSIKTTLLITLT